MNAIVTAIGPKQDRRYGQSLNDQLDEFMLAQTPAWPETGFRPLGDAWNEITRRAAADIVDSVTRTSMAYGARMKPKWIGTVAPEAFLGQFGADARFFTNQNQGEVCKAWASATTSTFDAGVAAIDSTLIGILWAQDED